MPVPVAPSAKREDLLDELSDDSLAEGMPTPDSAAENRAPNRSKDSQPKKTAPKTATGRRVSVPKRAEKTKSAGASRRGQRAPLRDTTNTRDGNETEEVDDFAQSGNETQVAVMAPRKAAATKQSKKPTATKDKKTGVSKQLSTSHAKENGVPTSEPPGAKRGRQPRATKRNAATKEHSEQMDMDIAATTAVSHGDMGSIREHDAIIEQQQQHLRHKSVPNTDPSNDLALQRQLTEVTRKLESVELKYKNLRDLAEHGAAENFERLKRLADERISAADELIASLRADLKYEAAQAKKAKALQSQIDTQMERNNKLAEDNAALHASLEQSQTDLRAVNAKLSATRSGSASLAEQTGRLNGSAVKQRGYNATASVEAAKDAQKQLLKEDLYGDLTGLLIRDVKRKEEGQEDVYDCIQTGRNGTLRFYLTVQSPSPGVKLPTEYSYSEAEFQYSPVLDETNDQQLISILPDYLTDEICFPRSQAAKFYSRIQDCMTKKFELVDDVDEEE